LKKILEEFGIVGEHYFVKTFTEILKKKKTSNTSKQRNVPWWSNELKTAIKLCNTALQKFRTTNAPDDLERFRLRRAQARRLIRSSKRDSWNQFLDEINIDTNPSTMWRKIQILNGTKPPPPTITLKTVDGYSQDPTTTSTLLAEAFASVSSNQSYSKEFLEFKTAEEATSLHYDSEDTEDYNQPITEEELRLALGHYIKNTAPGPDDIPAAFLRHLPPEMITKLLFIYNKIWQERCFPSEWRMAIIVPILKPGKDRHLTTSFRPIALTCVPCKILEKIIAKRLLWTLKKLEVLSPHQCGFTQHHSTLTHLSDLQQTIQTAFQQKQYLVAVFFDIEKAYDMAWSRGIIKKLTKSGLCGRLVYFIDNFLQNRSIQVRVGGSLSTKQTLDNGVPQGSVLSVYCFLLLINDIVQKIPAPIQPRLFADDLNITLQTGNLCFAERILQLCLDGLQEWSNSTGLRFSANKTKCVIFTRKNTHLALNLHLNGTPIKITTEAKFLGLTFDRRLTWKTHILTLKKNCLTSLNILKVLNNKRFGPTTAKLLNIYKILIRSKLDYGSSVYNSAADRLLRALEPVQNAGLRLALRAFPTSPVSSLQSLTGIPPLAYRRKLLAANHSIHSLSKLPNSPLISRSQEVLLQTIESLHVHPRIRLCNILQHIPPPIPPWETNPVRILWNFTRSEFKPATNETILQEITAILNQFANHTCCFTDGSKSPDRASGAYLIDTMVTVFELPADTNINTIEMAAIYQCLLHLPTEKYSKYILFSDSQTALRQLQANQHTKQDAITTQVLATIHHLMQTNEILFVWIPSHVGITGHDIADRASKSAATTHVPLINPPDLKARLRLLLYSAWQQEWSATNNNNKLRNIKDDTHDWTKLISKACELRNLETAVNRTLIGHTRLTHEYLLSRLPPPLCSTCNVTLTVQHIIHGCVKYQQHRPPSLTSTDLKLENIADLIHLINVTKLHKLL
jgi:ribonuclease HI